MESSATRPHCSLPCSSKSRLQPHNSRASGTIAWQPRQTSQACGRLPDQVGAPSDPLPLEVARMSSPPIVMHHEHAELHWFSWIRCVLLCCGIQHAKQHAASASSATKENIYLPAGDTGYSWTVTILILLMRWSCLGMYASCWENFRAPDAVCEVFQGPT
jgi:hypothetical protein